MSNLGVGEGHGPAAGFIAEMMPRLTAELLCARLHPEVRASTHRSPLHCIITARRSILKLSPNVQIVDPPAANALLALIVAAPPRWTDLVHQLLAAQARDMRPRRAAEIR